MTTTPPLPTAPNALAELAVAAMTPAQPSAPNVQTPDPAAQAQSVNPSNRPLTITEQIEQGLRRRISMSLPSRKLEVPELPGYWLHWFLEANVPRALEAGFEFVDSFEIPVTQFNPGTSKEINGNMDLGTRLRQVAGKSEQGGAEYFVLMKLREEWAAEDRAMRDKRNAEILATIFRGEHILGSEQDSATDKQQRYLKEGSGIRFSPPPEKRNQSLLQRPPRKRV